MLVEEADEGTGDDNECCHRGRGDEDRVPGRSTGCPAEPFEIASGGETGQERRHSDPCSLGDDPDRDHVELAGETEGGGGTGVDLTEQPDELLVEDGHRLAEHQGKGQDQVLLHRRTVGGDPGEPRARRRAPNHWSPKLPTAEPKTAPQRNASGLASPIAAPTSPPMMMPRL